MAMQQAVSGVACTATHEVIRRRYEALERMQEQLTQIIGEQEATTILVDVYNQSMK